MSKIIATLAIVSLFVSLASCTTTSQSGSFSSLYLNSSATKVYGVNSTTSGSADATWITIPYMNIAFGPATTNGTVYSWGWILTTTTVTIYRRSSNASIVANASATDTVEASYIASDQQISATGVGASGTPTILASGVGEGYLGLLALGTDSSGYSQVYFILASSASSASVKVVTANTGTSITYTSPAALFYDPGSYTFFYTFLGYFFDSGSVAPYTITINVGGYNASAAGLYFAAGSYSINAGTNYASTSRVTSLVIGGDNFTNATYIYVAYKDVAAATSYYLKITKATTTTSLGSTATLVADSAVSTNTTTYYPIGVWSSNVTYGIALSVQSVVSSGTPVYTIANWYNASTTGPSLSGVSSTTTTYPASAVYGFQLNTGFALLGVYTVASTNGFTTYSVTYAAFLANATLNTTASTAVITLASGITGPFNIFEDVNGAEWIGWTDFTYGSGTTVTAIGYLAKLQGQIFELTAVTLKGIMAFVAFCLAVVFAF